MHVKSGCSTTELHPTLTTVFSHTDYVYILDSFSVSSLVDCKIYRTKMSSDSALKTYHTELRWEERVLHTLLLHSANCSEVMVTQHTTF